MHTLSPPGFGVPSPPGWEPTAPNYREWLIAELEAIGGPLDVVGHDWGAGHVYAALAARPDLFRTWAADCAGLVHHDYVWHDMAQAWQTPEVGEQVVGMMAGQGLDEKQALFEGFGLDPETAAEVAQWVNEDMAACILGLYRSALQPYGGDIGHRLDAADLPPGLVIDASEDHYVDRTLSRANADRFGAGLLTLEGHGHWWMGTAAPEAADGLVAFWDGA